VKPFPRRNRPVGALHRGAGLLLVAVLAACAPEPAVEGTRILPAERARPLSDVRFESTPARIERGRYLANAAIGCVLCHSERDRARPGAPPVAGREYAGAVLAEEPGYRNVAPNLTPDRETGAGAWSDDMLARAIREGVGHDGRGLGGEMWWWAFRSLSDEDLASIVVYLRSLPAVRNALPARLLSPELERERAEGARPLLHPVAERPLDDPVERGRYLIAVADCMGCHTAWSAPVNPGFGAGGNPVRRFGDRVASANLTPDPTGLGGLSEELFVATVRTGRGGLLHPAMPWVAYGRMRDEDLGAIYRALLELPPVAHRVLAAAPPTACPVCGQQHGLGAENAAPAFERVSVELGALEDYLGTFYLESEDVSIEVTTRAGVLFASEGGGEPVELVPVAGGRFRGHGLTSPLVFERDASGAVTAIVTFHLGETRWPRVETPPPL